MLLSLGSVFSAMDAFGLQRYAIGLLGEYLSSAHFTKLKKCFDLPPVGKKLPYVSLAKRHICSDCHAACIVKSKLTFFAGWRRCL